MRNKPTLWQRLRYAFDNTLVRGPAALIVWLALATMALVLLAVALDLLAGGVSVQAGLGPGEVFWNILFQALVPNPPGNLDSPLPFLLIMLGVTLASLAMVSILIGLLSASIQERLDHLRRGRSLVLEEKHTVILGWSEQIFTIVSQLITANANHRRSSIAILGDKDKVEMEEELRQRIPSFGRTRVVVRRGNPTQHADLDLVSPQTCKAVIVLPDKDRTLPDATTIKTILALLKASNRRAEPYRVVTAIRKPANAEIARLVGGGELEFILNGDIIARIMAQTCRQAGLSFIYTELLQFEGSEIYFQNEPALVGKTFGQALDAYEDSTVIGLVAADGTPRLLPRMDTVIQPGEQVIAISEDDDTVRLSGLTQPPLQPEAIVEPQLAPRAPERTLILGWNWRGDTVARQLDAYVAPGSALTIVTLFDLPQTEMQDLARACQNQTVEFRQADTTNPHILDALDLAAFQHIVLLAYSDSLEEQEADAITLLTLLHVRRIAEQHGHSFSVVSEIIDLRNRELAETTRVDDFIMSDRIVSLLLAQLSENPALNRIFEDIFDPTGSEIYLKPAREYVKLHTPLSFYTVVEAARRRGEAAIGYRVRALEADRTRGYGIVLNPAKSAAVTFAENDLVIVLGEA